MTEQTTEFQEFVGRFLRAFEVEDLPVSIAGVKIYDDEEPPALLTEELKPHDFTLPCCHATRLAMLGDAVFLDQRSIGCVAAAVSLGLVEAEREAPLEGRRVYTELMREQSGLGEDFVPPSPREFSDGTVYSCKAAGKEEYALFGEADSGRYKDRETAYRAASTMPTLKSGEIGGVLFFAPEFDELGEIVPDVVVLSLRPVELTRAIQGYQFITGERLQADMGGLRAVCSDLITRTYTTGQANVSPFCLGARLLAKFEPDRMGLGMTYSDFRVMVQGMEESTTGFPYPRYPGAEPNTQGG